MAKNAQLLQALNNLNKATPEGIKALDDLVKAGYATAKAFRDAIIANKEFWKSVGVEDNLDNYLDNDGFLVALGENDPNKTFVAMYKLAAEKRIILGLQSANEAVLKSLIAPAHQQPLRAALAGDTVATAIGNIHTAPGWNAADEAVITNEATDRIQLQAQLFLLLNKINACKPADAAKMTALFTAIHEANDANFKVAVIALGVDEISADKMAVNLVGGQVRSEVAKRNFSFLATSIYRGIDKPFQLLGLADQQFKGALPNPYNNDIAAEDVPFIRGILGEQHILAVIEHMDHDKAMDIVKIADTGALCNELGGNPFLDVAVHDQNIALFRHSAGVRALKLEIEKSEDLSALRSLFAARNMVDLNKVLDAAPLFGFAGDTGKELRKVFKDTSALVSLIPSAHVRLSLLTGNVDKLQKLIKDAGTPTDFRNTYFGHFPLAENARNIAHIFEPYFNNPENRFMLRQQAFLAVAKSKFSELGADALLEIRNAHSGEALRRGVFQQLGIDDNSADDLIDDSNDKLINKMLHAYANIEMTIKLAPGNNFIDLLATTNGIVNFGENNNIPKSDIYEAQRKLATILISKCPPTNLKDLIKLTQAKNLVEMDKALEELGVTNREWLSVDNMEELRKAALPRAIELKIDAESTIGKGARPQLLALFLNNDLFSPEKQKALLADDKLMKAVMDAEPANLVKMLKIKSSLVASDTPLHAEYERIRLSGRIQNAEIARIIAGMPVVVLTTDKVKAINTELLKASLALDKNAFLIMLKAIVPVLDLSDADLKTFNEGFGLDAKGDNYVSDNVVNEIINQNNFNKPTIAKRNPSDSPKLAVYEFIATLNKNQDFSIVNGKEIVGLFETATDRKQLLKEIKEIQPAIDATTLKSFEQKLTQDMYNTLKRPFTKALFLDTDEVDDALDDSKAELKTRQANLKEWTDIDSDVLYELKRLSELSTASWLDPAFQSAAHRNAYAMKQHFTELSDVCDIVVNNLADKQAFYQEKLNSLPSTADMDGVLDAAQQKSVEKHRVELEAELEYVSKGLALYTKLQTVLKGDPNQSEDTLTGKGVLNALDDAMSGRPVKFLSYETKCVKYPKSQMQAHLQRGYEGAKAEAMELFVALGAQDKPYGVDPDNSKLGKDEFFEHTIGTGADEGYFIEERGPRDQQAVFKPGQGGGASAVDFPIEVKLRPTKLPASEKGLIQTSMAMASKLLAGEKPSLNNKILLQCTDGTKAKHLWTALMAQMMAQGISAKDAKSFIVVRSPFFNPEKEMGMMWGLDGDSLYETKYKNHDTVTSYQKDMKQLTEDKDASEKSKVKVAGDLDSAASKFLKSKDVIDKLKKENVDNESETPSIRFK